MKNKKWFAWYPVIAIKLPEVYYTIRWLCYVSKIIYPNSKIREYLVINKPDKNFSEIRDKQIEDKIKAFRISLGLSLSKFKKLTK